MGDPRKFRRLYEGPSHPWQAERIEAEKILLQEYGLKNKRELYRIATKVSNFTKIAKRLTASEGSQAAVEKEQLFAKLHKLGLLITSMNLDDVLGMQTKALLDRRLQTLLFRKGMARTIGQARQFVSHKHVLVNGKIITSPGYLVSVAEEAGITFVADSTLASAEHPERVPIQKKVKKARPRRDPRDRRGKRR